MTLWIYLKESGILSLVLRLLLTSVCSGIMGYEREKRNQAAGFRTYMIVSNASALVMMVNQYVFEQYGMGDPVRMGAQVISGIGFLGAGAILVTRNQQVRGLTTAAGLWSAAIIGMAMGAGYYAGGIACFLVIYISMKFLTKIDTKIAKQPRMINMYCELSKRAHVKDLIRYARNKKYSITHLQVDALTKEPDGEVAVTFVLHTNGAVRSEQLLAEMEEIRELSFVAQV
ncbi:MAG: MgtC/SapB family protein [Oscillospiraceae bacterium]|nr:MgtC/SapB family protein [Oscillospiraceae bacterium]